MNFDTCDCVTIENAQGQKYSYYAHEHDSEQEEEPLDDKGRYIFFHYERLVWMFYCEVFNKKDHRLISFKVTRFTNGEKLNLTYFNHYRKRRDPRASIHFNFNYDVSESYILEAVYKKRKSLSTIRFTSVLKFRILNGVVLPCK
jgi:hypothetical protein